MGADPDAEKPQLLGDDRRTSGVIFHRHRGPVVIPDGNDGRIKNGCPITLNFEFDFVR
jgi:hypothetical protein